MRHFLQICSRVTALDSRQNLVFAQYLEKSLYFVDRHLSARLVRVLLGLN